MTPDGRHVVSASHDQTLKVWELATGRALATLAGYTDVVTACAVTPDGRHVVSASWDQTLKVWELATGRALATLAGHAGWVTACAVTPDGRHVVSASDDQTLKVWDLDTYVCCLTHRGDVSYNAVAATATVIVAGDRVGCVWFLDISPSYRSAEPSSMREDMHRVPAASAAHVPTCTRPVMTKHDILFLAANPHGTDPRALDREARAIQVELERSGHRDRFELVTRWAAEPLDLLRELRKLRPTVVHFSGRGDHLVSNGHHAGGTPGRDVVGEDRRDREAPRDGLSFQGPDGQARWVSPQALQDTFGAAGSSVQVVVLDACYSATQAEALLAHVDCVVSTRGTIRDDDARSFAIGFYGGLGERASIAAAYRQGCAAMSLEGLSDADRPQLAVRDGIDAEQLVLAADPPASATAASAAVAGPTSTAAAPTPPRTAVLDRPTVDIGILTIRDDEFRAVLGVFPAKAGVYKGPRREYTLRHAELKSGERYTLAILRQIEQGNGEAQSAARDLIDDLAPRLVLVVGIAGGLPSTDVTLGDVILSTRIHDFTVSAQKAGQDTAYAAASGPIDSALAATIANLAAREDEMGDWTAGLPSKPTVRLRKDQLYGPPEWQRELREKLEHHHGKRSTPRAPVYMAGPIASSDRLIKDPELLFPWITTARSILAIEMESGGVYRAARERCPMLAIRGISDIVGLSRADAWTKFACASAAAFTRAFLRTQPVPVGSSLGAADPS